MPSVFPLRLYALSPGPAGHSSFANLSRHAWEVPRPRRSEEQRGHAEEDEQRGRAEEEEQRGRAVDLVLDLAAVVSLALGSLQEEGRPPEVEQPGRAADEQQAGPCLHPDHDSELENDDLRIDVRGLLHSPDRDGDELEDGEGARAEGG